MAAVTSPSSVDPATGPAPAPLPLASAAPPAERGLRFTLRALRHRNYRLFFTGQLVSLVGSWMTSVAMSWLVYRLTHSPLLLGAVGFAGQLPAFLVGPIAGVLVDRFDKRRVLVVTQALAMAQSGALAVLALGGWITVRQVLALALVQGVINAFDVPGRQAFLVEMIEERADLPNAIALNSSMFNAARLVGPSIGGVVIAAVGEGWCFAIDTVSYIGVIVALLLMRVAARPASARGDTRVLAQLRGGFRYVAASPPIRALLLLVAAVSLMGMPYAVLLPVFASTVLHGGAHTLGFLMAATGLGALLGALYLASRRSVLGLGAVLPRAVTLFAAGVVTFAFSRWEPLSLAALVAAGFGFMVQMAASNTLLQTLVDDDKRGRVMSFYAMAFMGSAPFGSLLAGALAQRLGAPTTLALCGAGLLVAAAGFWRALPRLREAVRPIYVARGILPEAAVAIETAAELGVPPERAP
jgi:MFS family permease